MRDPALQDKDVWRKFIARFFKEYETLILDYFGLGGKETGGQPPIRLHERNVFLAVMSVLADKGVFDCDKKVLARLLFERFELNLKFRSVVQYICQSNGEYEDILHHLTKRKKTKKRE